MQPTRDFMTQIQTTLDNGVMHALIQRPERKNSLTAAMYASLCAALERADQDPQVKVLLLSGAGGVFTAGNELVDFVQNPPQDADASVFRFMLALAAFTKPLVAAVEGLAIGVGTTMLLHCDLVYVADNTRFALPFVGLGLVPEAGSSLLLPQTAGHQRASELLLLGDMFSAIQAQELGFVNRVLPAAEVLPFATQQARRLAALPAGSVQGTKALMKGLSGTQAAGRNGAVAQRIRDEAGVFVRRVTGPATVEAIAAFKEKRKPDFAGKD
jgi:enoyl-CoA hydratase/carnithine racemase